MSFIPKQAKLERDMLTIRLDPDIHAALQEYTEFLESSRDYVIGETLRVAFAKDREFQQWRTTRAGSEAHASGEGAEQPAGPSTAACASPCNSSSHVDGGESISLRMPWSRE